MGGQSVDTQTLFDRNPHFSLYHGQPTLAYGSNMSAQRHYLHVPASEAKLEQDLVYHLPFPVLLPQDPPSPGKLVMSPQFRIYLQGGCLDTSIHMNSLSGPPTVWHDKIPPPMTRE